MEIRALREEDDRSQFHSGDPDLDRFFHRFAGQNQFRHYVGVTYVAVDEGRVLGFATIAPGHIEIEDLPAATRKKLPRYPLPVLRLARLAVDQDARGQGLGRRLLRFVLELAVQMANDYGCIGVCVDAKPDAVELVRLRLHRRGRGPVRCSPGAHPDVPGTPRHPRGTGGSRRVIRDARREA